MIKAAKRAAYWAKESLSNPNTGRTDVKILNLGESERTVNQRGTDIGKKLRVDGNSVVLSCTSEDKLLLMALEKNKQN